MKFIKYLKVIFPAAALTLVAAAIIIYPERYINCCFKGFAMWAECVLPSLFPLMVVMLIAIKSGCAERAALPLRKVTALFSLPPTAAICLFISVFSGYPAGARSVLEYYENGCLDSADCKKICLFASSSGPLFIIGSIGVKMLKSKGAGWKILFAHLVAVLAVAAIFMLAGKKPHSTALKRAVPDENVLYNSFYGAVLSVAVAGGFIAFFCVTAQIFYDFNLLLPLEKLLCLFCDEEAAKAVCLGLVEATCGCRELAAANGKLTVPFMGFLITFGGASILLQQLSYLTKAKVRPMYFIGVKLLQGAICFVILLPFYL